MTATFDIVGTLDLTARAGAAMLKLENVGDGGGGVASWRLAGQGGVGEWLENGKVEAIAGDSKGRVFFAPAAAFLAALKACNGRARLHLRLMANRRREFVFISKNDVELPRMDALRLDNNKAVGPEGARAASDGEPIDFFDFGNRVGRESVATVNRIDPKEIESVDVFGADGMPNPDGCEQDGDDWIVLSRPRGGIRTRGTYVLRLASGARIEGAIDAWRLRPRDLVASVAVVLLLACLYTAPFTWLLPLEARDARIEVEVGGSKEIDLAASATFIGEVAAEIVSQPDLLNGALTVSPDKTGRSQLLLEVRPTALPSEPPVRLVYRLRQFFFRTATAVVEVYVQAETILQADALMAVLAQGQATVIRGKGRIEPQTSGVKAAPVSVPAALRVTHLGGLAMRVSASDPTLNHSRFEFKYVLVHPDGRRSAPATVTVCIGNAPACANSAPSLRAVDDVVAANVAGQVEFDLLKNDIFDRSGTEPPSVRLLTKPIRAQAAISGGKLKLTGIAPNGVDEETFTYEINQYKRRKSASVRVRYLGQAKPVAVADRIKVPAGGGRIEVLRNDRLLPGVDALLRVMDGPKLSDWEIEGQAIRLVGRAAKPGDSDSLVYQVEQNSTPSNSATVEIEYVGGAASGSSASGGGKAKGVAVDDDFQVDIRGAMLPLLSNDTGAAAATRVEIVAGPRRAKVVDITAGMARVAEIRATAGQQDQFTYRWQDASDAWTEPATVTIRYVDACRIQLSDVRIEGFFVAKGVYPIAAVAGRAPWISGVMAALAKDNALETPDSVQVETPFCIARNTVSNRLYYGTRRPRLVDSIPGPDDPIRGKSAATIQQAFLPELRKRHVALKDGDARLPSIAEWMAAWMAATLHDETQLAADLMDQRLEWTGSRKGTRSRQYVVGGEPGQRRFKSVDVHSTDPSFHFRLAWGVSP